MELSGRVVRELGRLPADEKSHILEALDKLTDGPWQKDSSKLNGRSEWRLRIGTRRALFLVDAQNHSITVVALGTRGDVYKDD